MHLGASSDVTKHFFLLCIYLGIYLPTINLIGLGEVDIVLCVSSAFVCCCACVLDLIQNKGTKNTHASIRLLVCFASRSSFFYSVLPTFMDLTLPRQLYI